MRRLLKAEDCWAHLSPKIPACFGWNSSLVWQFGEILLGWAADHWLLITVDIQVFNHVWLSAAPISFLEFISRDIHQLFSFIPGMMIPLQVMKANTYSPEKVHSVSDQKLLHRPCLRRSLSVSFGIKFRIIFLIVNFVHFWRTENLIIGNVSYDFSIFLSMFDTKYHCQS